MDENLVQKALPLTGYEKASSDLIPTLQGKYYTISMPSNESLLSPSRYLGIGYHGSSIYHLFVLPKRVGWTGEN